MAVVTAGAALVVGSMLVAPATASATSDALRGTWTPPTSTAATKGKDYAYASALRAAGLIDIGVLRNRLPTLPADPRAVHRIRAWIDR